MNSIDSIKKYFGDRVRLYRSQIGLSQEQLAEKAGLHRTHIGQIERGEGNPTLENICKIACALNISVNELFEKITVDDPKNQTAVDCYKIILEQSTVDQEYLKHILLNIIRYKDA